MNDRHNSEGIPRSQLAYALTNRKIVAMAKQKDSCLLCCRPDVNEAGICRWCYSTLDAPELTLAVKWMSGVGP